MRAKTDVFLPFGDEPAVSGLIAQLREMQAVNQIFLSGVRAESFPMDCRALPLLDLKSTDSLKALDKAIKSPYLLLTLHSVAAHWNRHAIRRLLQVAEASGASAVYSDYYDVEVGVPQLHPLLDYQKGSLRMGFDFGPFILVRSSVLHDYLGQSSLPNYSTAALYDFRLYLSRQSLPLHLAEPLYTVEGQQREAVDSTSDYEAEQALTHHLAELEALVDVSSLSEPDFDEQPFTTEASVIIPVFNREATIGDAVRSALRQKTSFKFNVIVVDNHSTDATPRILQELAGDPRLVLLTPQRHDLSIGGCWNLAVEDERCGRFAVQLDSDDLYSSDRSLQRIVDTFYQQKAAMVVGSYQVSDLKGRLLRPDVVSHREWTTENGCNNLLRMNGVGAPRAFFTPLLRQIGFPNVGYGEDYAVALAFSRSYRVARIFDPIYVCRRGAGNVTAHRSLVDRNAHDAFKDRLRTLELTIRHHLVEHQGSGNDDQPLERFFDRQLDVWPEVAKRYRDLQYVLVKKEGDMLVQYNPARIVSTGASVDEASIAKRPCFLCLNHRPKEQMLKARNSHFVMSVNPFPILPMHFTISSHRHRKQSIADCYVEIYKLLSHYPELTVFYNGPHSGASAPDHLHLQAGTSGLLPIQSNWKQLSRNLEILLQYGEDEYVALVHQFPSKAIAVRSKSQESFLALFPLVLRTLPRLKGEAEPRLNVLAWREEEVVWTIFFPRSKHRPDAYYAEGDGRIMVSPGALDMSGLVVLPRREDYEKMTPETLSAIIDEVSVSDEEMNKIVTRIKKKAMAEEHKTMEDKHQPQVTVGIVSGQKIEFSLNGAYEAKGERISGNQVVEFVEGGILWMGNQYRELSFQPVDAEASFSLKDVTIGVNFHWERKETQTFLGTLRLVVEAGKICAINELPVEAYLASVISSEMSATSSLELLKAHAVISRSWLLAQMEKRRKVKDSGNNFFSFIKKEDMLVKWYDREDHTIFDVCADDHCQRYQGITKETSPHVLEAVKQTKGQVLTSEGEICDARFSKCCGGALEEFQYCWEDSPKPYLKSLVDTDPPVPLPDLTDEEQADKWIRSAPPAFCNTTDKHVLAQVLNDYDQETTDFYRWHVSYTQQQVADLLLEKLKMDFGQVLDLVPVQRGKSGRICLLKIVGTQRTFTLGKELEIRRALSKTHLYSSAFVVDKKDVDAQGVPRRFEITGAGWGHGVGLCQIGAAVMGEQGYTYRQILSHYYPGAEITRLYK